MKRNRSYDNDKQCDNDKCNAVNDRMINPSQKRKHDGDNDNNKQNDIMITNSKKIKNENQDNNNIVNINLRFF